MKIFRWCVVYLWYEAFVNKKAFDRKIFELVESFYQATSEYLIYYITKNQ